MDMKVLRRVFKGLVANIYGQLVTVVIQLVGVPILLHSWGTQLYGEWLILFAIPAYLSMTDLGFSQSAGNDMTARVGRDDFRGALNVFQSLTVLVYSLVVVGLILTAVFLWLFPLLQGLHFHAMNLDTARWVLWLLFAAVLFQLPDGVSHAGFRSSGEYALHLSLHHTARLLQFASIWIAALTGGGPILAAAAFAVIRLLATFTFAVLLHYRHHWLKFGIRHAAFDELKRLYRPALANMAFPLAQALNVQGMVLVVGVILGPIAVVVFSTLRTLTRVALQMVLAVSHAVEPELAVAYGVGNRALMQALFVHGLRGGFWLAVVTTMGLAIFGNLILGVWTNGKVQMYPELFAWLLASAVISVLWYGALIVLKSANKHLRAATVYVLASASAVAVAALLLTLTQDLSNAGLSLLLMDATMTFYTLYVATRFLDTSVFASLILAINPYPLVLYMYNKLRR